MNKKIGKFKLWQLVALGAAIGLAVYLYSKKEGGAVNPEEVVGGTGTGAFGPIDPDTGIPYAFEGGAGGGSGSGEGALNDAFGLIERAQELGGEGGEGGGETYTETIVQEPGEPTPLAQTKNHKPKRTGEAAHNKHSHKAPKHPKHRMGVGQNHPAKGGGKKGGKGGGKPKSGGRQRQPKQPKQRKPPKQRQRQPQHKAPKQKARHR